MSRTTKTLITKTPGGVIRCGKKLELTVSGQPCAQRYQVCRGRKKSLPMDTRLIKEWYGKDHFICIWI